MFQTQLLNAKVPIFTKVKQSYKTSNLSHSPRLAADLSPKLAKPSQSFKSSLMDLKCVFEWSYSNA